MKIRVKLWAGPKIFENVTGWNVMEGGVLKMETRDETILINANYWTQAEVLDKDSRWTSG